MDFRFPKQNIFDRYLVEYTTLPRYKRVLHSMIKYKYMYQERTSLPYLGKAMANEERAIKRAEIYMLKRDLINTYDHTHGKRIVVTSRGHKIFYKEYPLAKLRKESWDGNWTVVMYDFPQKFTSARNDFRIKLRKLGFGSIQKSILISPLPYDEDIQMFIEGEGNKEYVWTLKAKSVFGMANDEIAKTAWPEISEIFELYNILLNTLPKIKKIRDNSNHLKKWREYFLAVNTADPHLPYDLLDRDWPAEECEKEFIRFGSAGFLKLLFYQKHIR